MRNFYNAKIVTNKGDVLDLGLDYGIAFDITPLSGMDIDVSTSHRISMHRKNQPHNLCKKQGGRLKWGC